MVRLLVYFDGQFWKGVVESYEGDRLRAHAHTFGREPQDAELLRFAKFEIPRILERLRTSPKQPVETQRPRNPKRLIREAARALLECGPSTKAQEAIRLQRESEKREKSFTARARRRIEEERLFELHRRKAKEKHRGH